MGNCAYTAAYTCSYPSTPPEQNLGKSGNQLRWHESLRQYSKEKRHHLSLAAHRFYSTGYKAGSPTPNVELYQPQRRTSQLISPFRCAAKSVPAVRRVYRRSPPITSERTRVSGLLTEHPYDALIRCAMHDHALQAFALGCSALRKWCDFSNLSDLVTVA